MNPTLVIPFAGAAAEWLHTLDPRLVPLVSWMGGKRRLAAELLAPLGLRAGCPVPTILGDASWWGWVWPTVLDAVEGPEVSAQLRFWRDRDPRELWFWLRDVGPMPSRPEAAAQLLWLQARAASGVPVWWEGGEVLAAPGAGRERQPAADRGGNGLRQWASTKVDEAGQRNTRLVAEDGRGDPREAGARTTRNERLVANTRGNQEPGTPFEAGHKGIIGAGGIVDPGTVADRIDAVRAAARLVKGSGGLAALGRQDAWCTAKGWRALQPDDVADRADAVRTARPTVRVYHADALWLTHAWARRLGADARVVLDWPYVGATGYPATIAPEARREIAWTWARHGAQVVCCEAYGMAAELGEGWTQVQLRRGAKPEWITCYGCDASTALPPFARLLRGASASLPLHLPSATSTVGEEASGTEIGGGPAESCAGWSA